MKDYIKPDIKVQEIITNEIASGLQDFLEGSDLYQPGITTFTYGSWKQRWHKIFKNLMPSFYIFVFLYSLGEIPLYLKNILEK